ncbi:hypothetical protein CXX84_07365 [Arthrobacter sp. AFG7.2]|nr:hypothetical protein CXX84_07365 [Arthrobacter sp. AFG7.2]
MPKAKTPVIVAQSLALTVAVFISLIAAVSPAHAADNYGYESISYSGVANPPTADKPQSKLWWNDGSWWADMWTTGTGWQIHRLDRATKTWVSTGLTNDSRGTTSADTLWDGNKLYIASHVVTVSAEGGMQTSLPNEPAKLYRYSYAAGKYTLDAGFPTNINNSSSESLTIDKDSTGAIWATWTQVSWNSTSNYTSSVYVNSLEPNETTWGSPFVLPVADPNPTPDDISAIIAFAGKKIGVMWSDQSAGAVYWATRTDGTSRTAASSWKVQAAIQGRGQADDHLNIKALLADSAGRVFAATKTSLDNTTLDKTLPQLQLLVFKPGTGAFTKSTIATVADCVSRPQILLDTATNKVRAFYTAPSTSASGCAYSGVPGSIYEKTASMDDPVFETGRGTPVIQDGASAGMNNVTTTKQSVNATTGVVVLASNKETNRYWYSDRSLGTAPSDVTPPTVTATSPAADAKDIAVNANVTGTFSEAMDASTVTSGTFTLTVGTTPVPAAVTYTGNVATVNPSADLAAGTTYTATIRSGPDGVKDAAGNALASDRTWNFTTASGGGVREYNGDGKADLIARDSSGTLWTYPGLGNGLFGSRINVGGGWNVMTAISAAGDLTGDGKADLSARDSSGTLWTYPGLGNGLFGSRINVGGGWNVMTAISAAGDLTGDGKADLSARDSSGTLWTYPGLGNGLFGSRINVGGGWNVMTAISAAGDLTGDGKADLSARDSSGTLWTYPGLGNGLFGSRINVGGGWNVMTAIS